MEDSMELSQKSNIFNFFFLISNQFGKKNPNTKKYKYAKILWIKYFPLTSIQIYANLNDN